MTRFALQPRSSHSTSTITFDYSGALFGSRRSPFGVIVVFVDVVAIIGHRIDINFNSDIYLSKFAEV